MENLNSFQIRVTFSVPAELLEEFKEIVSVEESSIPKVISQFMFNYTNFLDKSFIKTQGILKGKLARLVFLVSEEICTKFKKKAEREKIWPSLAIAQFMRNYVDFTNVNEKKDRRT